MFPVLETLRGGEVPPDGLLAGLPGRRVWYLDDGPRADPGKSAWAPDLDPAFARRKQSEGCGVFCTLAAFAPPPDVGEVGPVRAVCVDVTLAGAGEPALPTAEADRRKELYLDGELLGFPPCPHWLVETRHGFQAVFLIEPASGRPAEREALHLSRRLAQALGGDEAACGVLQHVRVPGWAQLDVPGSPFACRLLLDESGRLPAYDRGVLLAAALMHSRPPRPA